MLHQLIVFLDHLLSIHRLQTPIITQTKKMFNEENKLLCNSQSSLLNKKTKQSIRYLRVVDESEVIVRALYAFLQLLDKSQSSRNHRHVLEDRRVTWKTSKQLKTQDKIITNTPVMLLVDSEVEDRTLGFLFLHLIFEDHLATFQFLVKHFDQPGISSLSIGCYQGSFQQSAKHEQNLPSRDSMKLCCHFCIEKTINPNAFHHILFIVMVHCTINCKPQIC